MRNATDVTILLDRSGSMMNVWSDMIGGINGFVEEQKKADGDCAVSFILFDSINDHEIVCESRNVREFSPVAISDYRPRGGTPLIDAMAKAIQCTGERLRKIPEEHRPNKVIFICVTDGGENESRTFTRDTLASMITHQREQYSWEFMFLGANFDVFGETSSYGIPMMAASSYHYSSAGVSNAFMAAASNVRSYRSGKRMTASFTAAQQDTLSSADVKLDEAALAAVDDSTN